jgi:hypothetical protein
MLLEAFLKVSTEGLISSMTSIYGILPPSKTLSLSDLIDYLVDKGGKR